MAIKEKDLPQVGSLGNSDFVRAVSSGGTSELVLYSDLEADPLFSASPAAGITSNDIDNWNNGKIELDTTAAAGTTDGDLYAAIVALGWENDVIE